jgi:ribonuclease HI
MGAFTIVERKFTLCPTLSTWPTSDLIVECPNCRRFFLMCCDNFDKNFNMDKPCYHYPLVFVDGACSSNGKRSAASGPGVALGTIQSTMWSIPVDEDVDAHNPRTNQRAELFAAIEGVKQIWRSHIEDGGSANDNDCLVIVTDSEYVYKGVTLWYSAWQVNRPDGPSLEGIHPDLS